jgi:cell division protein FtsB
VNETTRQDRDTPRRARSRRGPVIAVLLLVALAITLAGIFPFRQMIAQQRRVENTEAKLETLLAENARLEQEKVSLESATDLERIAREQYGLVRPGETGYTIDPPEPELDRAVPDEPRPLDDDRSPLEKVWDFLTGRDLVPDG